MKSKPIAAKIRRDEWPFVALMFTYFFVIITAFWILKPIKKSLFIDYYSAHGHVFSLFGWQLTASQAELFAKIGNMVAVFFAVLVFSWLADRLRRQQLTYVFAAFSFVMLLLYGTLLPGRGEATVWTFYIFGDLYNSLMVATFFAFLNDSVSPTDARRLYGPIILGGVCGGAFGSMYVRAQIDNFQPTDWALICAFLMVVIAAVAAGAGRWVERRDGPTEGTPAPGVEADSKGGAALAGARMVVRSRYLLAIVGLVGLYELVSVILDYQFTATVDYFVAGSTGEHFSTVYAATNFVALLIQLFLTANVMSRFGVKAALMVMPLLILGGSWLFLFVPLLWIGSSLNLHNAFNYSINQSARESLYTPLTRDEKYKAKAFIDMFLYRTAKVVGVGVVLLLGAFFDEFTAVRWLSTVTIILAAAWIAIARYAGSRFRDLSEQAE